MSYDWYTKEEIEKIGIIPRLTLWDMFQDLLISFDNSKREERKKRHAELENAREKARLNRLSNKKV